MRFLGSLMILLALCASSLRASDTAPPEGASSAERGQWLLFNKNFTATEITAAEFADLWKVWPEPLRSEAEKATPAERRKLAFARYGHVEMPGRDLPMGYVNDGKGGWAMNCLACHGGKVAGQPVAGLGNSHFAFQTWGSDIVNYRVKYENKSRAALAGNLLIPLSRSNGTTNAQIFSVVFTTMRDSDLKFTPPVGVRVPKMLHHDLDAPPFWNLKHKKMLYIDGFVEKSPRVIMQFVLLPSNNAEKIKSWENDFKDILAYAESITPPAYPWSIDESLRARGREIFVENCASCHGISGPGGNYPEKRVPIDEVGTDRRRLQGLPIEHRRFFKQGWMSEEGTVEVVEEPDGYIAPPLDGIWASAPYFHNGSVPTLWHLMHPESRPSVWLRDADGYDEQRVGLKVAEFDKLPETATAPDDKRRYFDTKLVGKSAVGHDFPSALSEEERAAVIEYLKSL